jgi:hypothetical protein
MNNSFKEECVGSKQNFARFHFLSAKKLMEKLCTELKTRLNFRFDQSIPKYEVIRRANTTLNV